VGGACELAGAPAEARLLAHALEVASAAPPRRGGAEGEDDPDRVHVHGFHSYPARMHPLTAGRLVASLTAPGALVLDPFCGSGTVLVEAMLAGRDASGVDANPLAVELSWLKIRPRDPSALEALPGLARQLRAEADRRRRTRAGATHRYPAADVALFEPHVLLELDSLHAGIARLEDEAARRDLALVLSAILVKVSRKAADTSDAVAPRRVSAGYTSRLFAAKAGELARRLTAFHAALPAPPPRAAVREGDAARLEGIAPRSVDAVISSPPYAATYDYLAHHEARLRWLGLDPRGLASRELGARRRYAQLSPTAAVAAWRRELKSFLAAMGRVARPGAPLALLVADSAVGTGPTGCVALRAETAVAEALAELPLRLVARASQPRPHFHRDTQAAFREAPRREHALLLRAE